MAIVAEIIRIEEDETLSFGNYLSEAKCKISDFEVEGDIYKVKTYNKVTRLEKNEKLLFESVPGASAHHFKVTEKSTCFSLEGSGNTQIIMELLPNHAYRIIIDGMNVGHTKSNVSGKINFSVDLHSGTQKVQIESMNELN